MKEFRDLLEQFHNDVPKSEIIITSDFVQSIHVELRIRGICMDWQTIRWGDNFDKVFCATLANWKQAYENGTLEER